MADAADRIIDALKDLKASVEKLSGKGGAAGGGGGGTAGAESSKEEKSPIETSMAIAGKVLQFLPGRAAAAGHNVLGHATGIISKVNSLKGIMSLFGGGAKAATTAASAAGSAGAGAASAAGAAGAAGAGAAGAGAAGAGAAGAGAAGAAGAAGVAAIASNPVGWIIGAAVALTAVTVAVASIPGMINDFAKGLMEANRQLAEFSPSMAAIMAQSDVAKQLRQLEKGERTSSSARSLAQAQNTYEDNTKEINILWADLKNYLGFLLEAQILPIVTAVNEIAKVLNAIRGNTEKENKAELAQEWLDGIAAEEAKKQQYRREQFGKPMNQNFR